MGIYGGQELLGGVSKVIQVGEYDNFAEVGPLSGAIHLNTSQYCVNAQRESTYRYIYHFEICVENFNLEPVLLALGHFKNLRVGLRNIQTHIGANRVRDFILPAILRFVGGLYGHIKISISISPQNSSGPLPLLTNHQVGR